MQFFQLEPVYIWIGIWVQHGIINPDSANESQTSNQVLWELSDNFF